MDGMTVVATYENGQLIMAATRGNGEIGENVTHNARCIKGLPMKIRENRQSYCPRRVHSII